MLCVLLVCHAIADYPLQGDFIAKAKNHMNPIPCVPFYQPLTAHAMIHGGFVGFATGSILLGIFEFIAHWIIDFGKCDNWFSDDPATAYNIDQFLHVICKVIWVILWMI